VSRAPVYGASMPSRTEFEQHELGIHATYPGSGLRAPGQPSFPVSHEPRRPRKPQPRGGRA